MTERNDPCHCGSGRKYKRCCQQRDAAEANASEPHAGLSREQREYAASERIWAADAVPVMVNIEEGAPRPVLLLVMAGDIVVHQDLVGRLNGGAEAVAGALDRAIRAAGRVVGSLPERITVRHDDVSAVLAAIVPPDIRTETADAPNLIAYARALLESIAGHDIWPPACHTDDWDAWGLPHQTVRDLFAAAASFYRRAPWRHAANMQAPRAVLPSGRGWTCCILGNAGEEFGLSLFSDAADLFDVVAARAPDELYDHVIGRIITLSFESARTGGPDVVRMVRRRRLDLAGPSAYPLLTTINTPGGGVSVEEITELTALLRALPDFVDAHRAALEQEELTGDPGEPIEWTDPISGIAFRYAGEGLRFNGETDPSLPFDLGDEFREVFAQVAREHGPDADTDTIMAALNRALESRTHEYNEQPQGELGGLSPLQVRRLLASDWDAPDDVVRLGHDIDPADVANSEFIQQVYAMLGFVKEHGPLEATQAGYFRPVVVDELIDRLQLADEYALLRKRGKRIIERDVWEVHVARVVCELAGLLELERQRFHVRRPELLEPERAAELHALLFRTWFGTLSIDYVSMFEWPELQRQIAFTLYRLPDAAATWKDAAELLPDVVLPFALEHAPASRHVDLASSVLARGVLLPLVGFGLLALRSRTGKFHDAQYRTTPLAKRFLRFEWD